MESLIKNFLMIGLKTNGFKSDFEAKADINGGFEFYLFSNGHHVAIITVKNVYSDKTGDVTNPVYKCYYCKLGDDEYLARFLELEGITNDPRLLEGEYRGLFMRLINKIRGYGKKNVVLLIRSLKNDDFMGEMSDDCVVHQFPNGKAIHAFS